MVRKVLIVFLLLWSFLAGCYVTSVWYTKRDTSRLGEIVSGYIYAAYKFENDTTGLEIYEPEELGIYKIYHYGVDDPTFINVVTVNDPFRAPGENPVFRYREAFYQIWGYGHPGTIDIDLDPWQVAVGWILLIWVIVLAIIGFTPRLLTENGKTVHM